MKAFIMAAGIGTRLRPLTYHIPKPLVPIINTPVIGHLMKNLVAHGIEKIVVNLHYYPKMIVKYLGDGKKWGVEIKYSYEKTLLGTAGGVKLQEKFFNDTFVVTSGDGLSDINFTKLVKFHKQKKAIATVALKEISAKLDYGLVIINKDFKVKNFLEKPSWESIYSNLVNTGIYVFEPEIFKYIPKNKFYDFGHDLLPLLVSKGLAVYGYVMSEYWCDVGNLQEYRNAQRDCLDGKINITISGEQIEPGVWVGKNTKLSSSVKLVPPVVIGDNVVIGKQCIIGDYTVVGNMTRFGDYVKVKDSILWSKVTVKSNVSLNSCIIGNSATVSESITMFEGTVIEIKQKHK